MVEEIDFCLKQTKLNVSSATIMILITLKKTKLLVRALLFISLLVLFYILSGNVKMQLFVGPSTLRLGCCRTSWATEMHSLSDESPHKINFHVL